MATARFFSEFTSMAGVDYSITIDDTLWVGTAYDFNVGENGFLITYDKDEGKTAGQIQTSSLEFDFIVTGTLLTAAVDTFLTAMLSAQEGRFKVKIEREGVLYWTGYLLTDLVERYDTSTPYTLRMRATDGLGILKGIDYNDAGTAYTGWETFQDHFKNVFQKLDLDYFHTTEQFFAHNISWAETEHTYTTSLDILANTRVNHEAFFTIDDKGNYKYKNCYEVLKEFAGVWGANLRLSGGVFRFYQFNEYETTTFKEWRYDKDFALISSNTSVSYSKTIDQTADAAVMSGRVFSYLPGLKKVKNTYTHKSLTNILAGMPTFTDSYNTDFFAGSLYLTGTPTAKFSATVKVTTTWTAFTTPALKYFFQLKLIVGNRYLVRDIVISGTTVNYNNIGWETLLPEEWYDIYSDAAFVGLTDTFPVTKVMEIPISFELPFVAAGDQDIYFGFDLLEVRNAANAVITNITDASYTYQLQLPYLEIIHDSNADNQANESIYEIEEDGNTNTEILEIESFIGDGPFAATLSRLQIYTGLVWQNSDGWRLDDTGTARLIQELRIYELLRAQSLPIQQFNADVIASDYYAHYRIYNQNTYWVFSGGTFSANADVWSGEWLRCSTYVGTTTTTTTTGVTPGTQAPSQTIPGTAVTFEPPRNNNTPYSTGTGVTTTSGGITTDGTDTIPIEPGVEGGLIAEGTLIFLVSSIDGSVQTVTATSSVSPTDTVIHIQPTVFDNVFPEGSFIVVPENQYESTATSTTETDTGYTDWWEVHEEGQIDDADYPLLCDDIEISTDPATGDGSTAGIKINTSGVAGYNNSSTTPRTLISPTTGVTTLYEGVLSSNAFFKPADGYGGGFYNLAQYEAFGAAWVHTEIDASSTALHIKTTLTRPPSSEHRLLFVLQGSLKDEILDYRIHLTVTSSSESITQSGDKSADITFSTYQSSATGNYICIKAVATSGTLEKGLFRIDLIRGWLEYGKGLTMPSISTITINTGTNI